MKQFIALLTLALLTAQGTTAETIYVNGEKITGTTSITTGGGTVSYNASTKVLTINNVVCNRSGSDKNSIDCKDVANLTIKMTGTNSLTANNASSVVCGGNVTIEIVSGTTSFISTAGSQNAIGLYKCNLTLTGAGTLNLQSSNGHALQGREGTSTVTMKIANCSFTTQQNGIYNLSKLTFASSNATPTVEQGLKKTTNIHFNAHTSATNAHVAGVTTISAPDYITIKRPTYLMPTQLTKTTYATSAVDITDEQVDTSQYTAYGNFVYNVNASTTGAVLVGADVVTRYTATTLNVPGFLSLGGKTMQVYIQQGAFSGMPQLTSAKVCYGARYLGWEAFSNCGNLTELTLPGSLTDIGGNVILGSNVSTVKWTTLDPSATNIASTAFRTYSSRRGILYLPTADAVSKATASGITTYMAPFLSKECYDVSITQSGTSYNQLYVYTNCATDSAPGEMALIGLSSAAPSLVIEDSSLDGYSYYSSLFGGDNRNYYCTSVAPTAFKGRTGLIGVHLRLSKIKTIGAEAFNGCSDLEVLRIGRGVTTIGLKAFYDCKIKQIFWEPANFPDFASSGAAPFYSSRNTIVDVVFSAGVQRVPAYLCAELSRLWMDVSLPPSVTEIGPFAFYHSSMPSISMPSVRTIGDNAFNGCSQLTKVELPYSVTDIGTSAFASCLSLTSFSSYPACASITLGTDVFAGSKSGCTLHVRPSQLAAYKAADQWKDFFAFAGDLKDPDYNPYDVNNDKLVDVGDVNTVLGDILATGGTTPAYDVNGDNKVDVGDVNAILAAILAN